VLYFEKLERKESEGEGEEEEAVNDGQ